MGFWRLGLVLFKLCLCSESRGAGLSNSTASALFQWRVVRRGSDLAPICSDVEGKNFWLVACKVRTERLRGGGGDCLIRHRDSQKSCEPRFSLLRRDQTLFLHLTALTPADSGLYQCRCVGGDQFHLNLNITVTGDGPAGEDDGKVALGQKGLRLILMGVAATITMATVFVGIVCCTRRGRRSSSASRTPRLSACETSCAQAASHIYSEIQSPDRHDYQLVLRESGGNISLADKTAAGPETDSGSAIYENILSGTNDVCV